MSAAIPSVPATPRATRASRTGRVASALLRQETILTALLIVLLACAGHLSPPFISARAQIDLSTHIWGLALLTLPATLIILTGGIDLSVGSTMSLCAVVFGLSFQAGLPIAGCVLLTLIAGAAAGLLNGIFVAYVRVHPLIVTLATLAAYEGIAVGISQGRPFSGFPDSFTAFGQGSLLGLPIPGVLFLVVFLIVIVLTVGTPLGLFLSAIGHNETAAGYSGIDVARTKLALYTSSGLCAAVSALLFCALRNTAKADIGQGMELNVVTAVVLGGTSIFGGRGTLIGTLLGVLLIHETREFVNWQYNRDELNLIVVGGLLILSVLLDSALSGRRR